jgi:transcriptional regulator with XRE-family HTH domain
MASRKRPPIKQLAKAKPAGYRGGVARGTKDSPPLLPKPLGERLRDLRKARGLTQQQLAELSQIPQVTISAIEVHPNPNPQWSTLVDLARGLGVDVARLVGYAIGPALQAFLDSDLCPDDITTDERERLAMIQPGMGAKASKATYAIVFEAIRGTSR